MARPRHSLFVLHAALTVLLMSVLDCKVTEGQELLQPPALPPSVLHPSNSLGRCENDKSLNDVCRACAALPPRMSLPVEECCTDDDASAICEQCLSDPVFCLVDLIVIENALFTSADLGDAEDDVGKPPQFDAIADDEDDDFTDMTQESEDDDMKTQKRWGTLGLGSSRYGRYSRGFWSPGARQGSRQAGGKKRWGSLALDKRWGSLGIGNGKRWGSLGFGRGWGSRLRGRKRWGSLAIGKRWGSAGFGDGQTPGSFGEQQGSLAADKRWGSLGLGGGYRLGLGSSGRRWGPLGFGRRSAPDVSGSEPLQDGQEGLVDQENLSETNRPVSTDKRWGSLGLGGWRKRWGTLGFGRRSAPGVSGSDTPQDVQEEFVDQENLSETSHPLSTDKRWGSLGLGGWRKRWGTLGFGKRSVADVSGSESLQNSQEELVDQENLSEANRPLSSDKRWGSLGLGGWRKRWGSLGIGRRSAPDTSGSDTLQDSQEGFVDLDNLHDADPPLSADKRWGSLGLGGWRKRWGSLGLGGGRRWGSRRVGKRQETLTGLDDDSAASLDSSEAGGKRWGTLSLGKRSADPVSASEGPNPDPKRWGTLGLGNRWGTAGGSAELNRWSLLGFGGKRSNPDLAREEEGKMAGGELGSPASTGGQADGLDLDTQQGPGAVGDTADDLPGAVGKRWGTLFMGKRNADAGIVGEGSDDPEQKKWGSLGIGKKWGSLGIGKKWGSLGIGKKWGSLGIGKKWGSLGIGKKWGSLGEGSDDPEQKKWGSLGIGKKWGSLGIGKKWGSLGIGKKWGSLGIGKKWGSLGIGKKSGTSELSDKSAEADHSH